MTNHHFLTFIALLGCAANTAVAETRYQITELGTLGGNSYSQAINKAGNVTGYSYVKPTGITRHAFNWKPLKGIKDMDTLGGPSSFGIDLNNKFQITGFSQITEPSSTDPNKSETKSRAYFWNSTKGMLNMGTLGGTNSYGYSLNDKGEVVGYSDIADNTSTHAFIWTKRKGMIDLGTLGGKHSYANGINKFGYVTGASNTQGDTILHAFLMKPLNRNPSRILTDIGTLGGDFSSGLAINDLSQVTGYSNKVVGDTQNYHAFIWSEREGMIDLGTLGGGSSYGNDVNKAGVVIGSSQFGETKDTHGFIWTKAAGIEDLNELIPSDSGWTITKANGINDKGQIAVLGFKTGVGSRALLLTPIKR